MLLHDTYDGAAAPFEGDLTLALRSLPAGAIVKRATLTLVPRRNPLGLLFEEDIEFDTAAEPTSVSQRFGATRVRDPKGTFVEIDFHKRRTLAAVYGAGRPNGNAAQGATLEVDLGGMYVQINDKGALKTPSDATSLRVTDDGTLPGLTVGKFKLSADPQASVDVSRVRVRSVPSNLSVRLGTAAPFWNRPGDLTESATSPDFAGLLQGALAKSPVVAGFCSVALTVHSDTLARLALQLEVDYLDSVALTPPGLTQIVLPYAYDPLPVSSAHALEVALPLDARLVASESTARVTGAFDPTRIVAGYGPPASAVPAGGAAVAPNVMQAQPIAIDAVVGATAIDVLIMPVSRKVALALDLRADLDGKPNGTSLLGRPVGFAMDGTLSNLPAWTSVALSEPFHFHGPGSASNGRYWLVLQSLDGEAAWSVVPATDPALPALQQTTNGGLAWRATAVAGGGSPGPLCAAYRLRNRPDQFTMPVALRIAGGDTARQVSLDRFAPLGRVDFGLDIPEIVGGINAHLDALPAGFSPAEHLVNGDLRTWLHGGSDPGFAATLLPPPAGTGADAPVDNAGGPLAVSPDGRRIYAAGWSSTNDSEGATGRVYAYDALRAGAVADSVVLGPQELVDALAIAPDGNRAFAFTQTGLVHLIDTAGGADLGMISVWPKGGEVVFDAIVSRDGATCFAATAGGLVGLDTAAVEIAVAGGQALPPDAIRPIDSGVYSALALAPGAPDLIYALRNEAPAGTAGTPGTPRGTLVRLDTRTGQAQTVVAPGSWLTGLALGADPQCAVVVGDSLVWVVDLAGAAVRAKIDLSPDEPLAVALAPDGKSAYVVVATAPAAISGLAGTALRTIDLARMRPRGTAVPLGAARARGSTDRAHIVAAAQGSRLFVGDGTPASSKPGQLVAVGVGAFLPDAWIVRGETLVAPGHAVSPADPVAELRSVPQTRPASLAQVVPVYGGSGYRLRFWAAAPALASARAELLWLDGQGSLLETATLAVDPAAANELAAHELPDVAPLLARAVEVRFTIDGAAVRLAGISLTGSDDLLVNGAFAAAPGASPAGWRSAVSAARVDVLGRAGAAGPTRLQNRSAQPAELVQTIAVGPRQLRLEFSGRVTSAGSTAPAVTVAYRDPAGADAGGAVELPLAANEFERHSADLEVPAAAESLELRVLLPPATSLAVTTLALRARATNSVPVAFVAQSPGELRVVAGRVAFDRVPAAPPAAALETPSGRAPRAGSCAADVLPQPVSTLLVTGAPLPPVAVSGPAPRVNDALQTSQHKWWDAAPIDLPLDALPELEPNHRRALQRAGLVSLADVAKAPAETVARALRGFVKIHPAAIQAAAKRASEPPPPEPPPEPDPPPPEPGTPPPDPDTPDPPSEPGTPPPDPPPEPGTLTEPKSPHFPEWFPPRSP